MKAVRRSTALVMLVAVCVLFASSVSAVSDVSISFWGITNDVACTSSTYSFAIDYTPNTDDGDGRDSFVVMWYDGNGTLIRQVASRIPVGGPNFGFYNTAFAAGGGWTTVNDAQARPIRVVVIDIPVALADAQVNSTNQPDVIDIANTQGTEISSFVFDPATVNPDCESLPLVQSVALSANCLTLPSGSVVGSLPTATRAYYSPGNLSTVTVPAGTYWVIGVDESGAYYKVLLACAYLWLPVETMQPSYQAPWSGQPLPTRVVG